MWSWHIVWTEFAHGQLTPIADKPPARTRPRRKNQARCKDLHWYVVYCPKARRLWKLLATALPVWCPCWSELWLWLVHAGVLLALELSWPRANSGHTLSTSHQDTFRVWLWVQHSQTLKNSTFGLAFCEIWIELVSSLGQCIKAQGEYFDDLVWKEGN